MAKIVTGSCGTLKVLVHDGYKYQLNAKIATTMTWRCWRKSCRVRLRTNLFSRDAEDAQIEVIINDDGHIHEADDKIIEDHLSSLSMKQKPLYW